MLSVRSARALFSSCVHAVGIRLCGSCIAQSARKYRGVWKAKGSSSFYATVMHQGKKHHLGAFSTAAEAAEAYDLSLRTFSPDPMRLKRSLNFPTTKEVAFTESPMQARRRGINLSGDNHAKEAKAFELLRRKLEASPQGATYELSRLSGASRADAIFHLRSCSEARGSQLQLKAATSRGGFGLYYGFRRTSGYVGMLMVLVDLDLNRFWAVAGRNVLVTHLALVVGTDREKQWRAPDIAAILVRCFQLDEEYPHASSREALLQCAPSNRVEAIAHHCLESLLQSVGMKLVCPHIHQSSVDSVLKGCKVSLRVQEKASSLSKQGVYRVQLGKRAGALGRLAYSQDDFDMLAASIVNGDQILGVFLIPTSSLVEHGFVADKAKAMRLCPPWRPPQRSSCQAKYAWQQRYFLDLRDWQDRSKLPAPLRQRLCMLILLASNLQTARTADE